MPSSAGGYLMQDNRASGGILEELSTYTCPHCNRIVVMRKDRKRERNWCRKCSAIVCDKAGCILNCIPMQRVIEMAARFPDETGYLLYGPNGEPLIGAAPLDKTKVY